MHRMRYKVKPNQRKRNMQNLWKIGIHKSQFGKSKSKTCAKFEFEIHLETPSLCAKFKLKQITYTLTHAATCTYLIQSARFTTEKGVFPDSTVGSIAE